MSNHPSAPGISRTLTLTLAVACGASAANLYYAQPLLHTIAGSFGTGPAAAGLIVTLSQVGYAAGLAFVVPIGDLMPRRRLVPAALGLTAVAMVVSAFAPDLAVLIVLAAVVGLGSVAAQILVPLAAGLADDDSRGQVVGTVMSGLLLGILLARTASGLVAGASSWRVVYGGAAGLVVVTAAVLARVLPPEGDRPSLRYGALLSSTLSLARRQPLIRRRGLIGGLGFAAFSVFWTTIAFLLAGPPYHYSDTVIGLFGLVGAAGAVCANAAGALADRGHARSAGVGFGVAVAVSFGPIALGRHSLPWLIVGIVLLDVGVQGLQVTNQSLIYGVGARWRSRANSVYMVAYFACGAIGSALAATIYASAGWSGVCLTGTVIGLAATAVAAWDRLSPASVRPVDADPPAGTATPAGGAAPSGTAPPGLAAPSARLSGTD